MVPAVLTHPGRLSARRTRVIDGTGAEECKSGSRRPRRMGAQRCEAHRGGSAAQKTASLALSSCASVVKNLSTKNTKTHERKAPSSWWKCRGWKPLLHVYYWNVSQMREQTAREFVKMWRPAALPDLEMLRATYVTQTFARHSHDGFAVGVIEEGALGFFLQGGECHRRKGRR